MSDVRLVQDAYGRYKPVKAENMNEYGLGADGTSIAKFANKTTGKITITSAQIMDIFDNDSFIQLIPAPGPGKIIAVAGYVSTLRVNTEYFYRYENHTYFDEELQEEVSVPYRYGLYAGDLRVFYGEPQETDTSSRGKQSVISKIPLSGYAWNEHPDYPNDFEPIDWTYVNYYDEIYVDSSGFGTQYAENQPLKLGKNTSVSSPEGGDSSIDIEIFYYIVDI